MKTGYLTDVTTDLFDAPVGSFLVAGWAGDSTDVAISSVVLSGGSLTWTARRADSTGQTRLWTAPCLTAKTGVTVIATDPSWTYGGLKAWVVTGVDLAAPVGKSSAGSSTTNNATVTGYTATKAGSLGFCVAYEDALGTDGVGNPSSSDPHEWYAMDQIYYGTGSGLFINKVAPAAAVNEATTFNLNGPGAAAAQWVWSAIEVLGLPEDARPRILQSVAAHRAASW